MLEILKIALLEWLIVTVMFGFVNVAAMGEGEAVIFIEPESIVGTDYKPSTNITFYVNVANVTDLLSLAFNITYAYDILSFQEFNLEYYKNLGNLKVGQGPGYLWFNLSYNTAIITDVPLTLVNVTLIVQDRGETLIDLHGTSLLSSDGTPILHTAVDGYFSNFNPYDINQDGIVDIWDIAIVAMAFGSYPGHERWNPDADVNDDGYVDIIDMTLVAQHFGEY
jgi:hypothetical protein